MKKLWPIPVALVLLFAILGLRNRSEGDQSFEKVQELTRIRTIGHQLLLTINDKTSLLPIQPGKSQDYRIRFQKSFSFSTDSLVNIVQANLTGYPNYSVLVRDRSSNEIVYSFVVSEDSSKTLIPCLDRQPAKGSYDILLHLSNQHNNRYWWTALILIPVLAGAWFLYHHQKQIPASPEPVDTSFIAIGRFKFYPAKQKLTLNDQEIVLTGKEGHLLLILTESLNTVVDRSRLQKEIWEDQGVMVTRSLDVFVSKLRRKLSGDPNVRLVSVHGKGYKLEADD